MRRSTMSLAAALAALLAAWPAAAEDRAVAVVERDYDKFGSVSAPDADALFGALRAAGMRVASGVDLDARDLRIALDDLSRADAQPGARIVVLTGKFVHSASDTWFLASDAAVPTLGTVDLHGMSVSSIIDLMRDGASRSVLLLGTDSGGVNPGTRMQDGIGEITHTGGVQVIIGTPQAVAAAGTALSRAGTTIATVLERNPSLRLVQGSGGEIAPLVPGRPVVVEPAAPPKPVVAGPAAPAKPVVAAPPAQTEPRRVLEGEAEAWVLAAARHDAESYRAFLGKYPEGRYAEVARGRLEQLGGASGDSPAIVELRLNLSRADRERIQRHLTRLNYDTNGIDGIFGKGTRAALTRWQKDNGRPATGYLDAQSAKLLKGEAPAKPEAKPAGDDATWRVVGQAGGAEGLRRYLKAYPEGRHAAQARTQLLEAGLTPEQRAAWQKAVKADSAAEYANFAAKYPAIPAGAAAKRRADWLVKNGPHREAEQQLGLTSGALRLIERRFEELGFASGEVDGRIDEATRKAIRAYQKSRRLPITGFLNDETIASLLADTLKGG